MTTPKLSVIIPIRENGSIGVIERLSRRFHYNTNSVEIILVDDGSLQHYANKIKLLVERLEGRYIRINSTDAPFSLSRARNSGLKVASAEFIYFEDVDFVGQSDFYQKLIEASQQLAHTPFNFIAVPTLFLTENASKELVGSTDVDQCIRNFIAELPFIDPDSPNRLINSYAPVGSNILVKRSTCFHVGLFDEYFNSWGGEDREFVFRLLHHNSRLIKPKEFEVTKTWKIHRTCAYEGWRSLYRLHGDFGRAIGLYQVHLYHPENSWKDSYGRVANFRYCDQKIADLYAGRIKISPTRISNAGKEHAVYVGRNPSFYNDDVMTLLGSVTIIEIDYACTPADFAQQIVNEAPTQIFFQNTYQNDWMHQTWQEVKRISTAKAYCVERGALPGTIYFDENGFCAESTSYLPSLWSNSQPINAADYFNNLKVSNTSLEPQGEANIKSISAIASPNKKLVLVLLQSLTDATTKHFTQPLTNYQEFLDTVRAASKELEEYVFLIKNHPLNKEEILNNCGVNVANHNIYDLIEIADACVVLNSGAGMIALAAGKPVIAMGRCFYAHDGLAVSAANTNELVQAIKKGKKPSIDSVNRFYGYLINEFYSFANWTYGSRDHSEATKMSLMRDIKYTTIRIGNRVENLARQPLNKKALIFDPYLSYLSSEDKTRSKEVSQNALERASNSGNNGIPTSRIKRKFAKLMRDPHRFFSDAKIKPLRKLASLIKRKAN